MHGRASVTTSIGLHSVGKWVKTVFGLLQSGRDHLDVYQTGGDNHKTAFVKTYVYSLKSTSLCREEWKYLSLFETVFTCRICPKGSSAGIVFTHEPIFRFFRATRCTLHVAPIKVKFGRKKRTVGQLLPTNFHLDRFRSGGLWPPKLKIIGILPI